MGLILTLVFGLALFALLLKYLEQGDVVRDLRSTCACYHESYACAQRVTDQQDDQIAALQAQLDDVQGWLAEGRVIVIPGSRADEG